jgi:hypothetical protein
MVRPGHLRRHQARRAARRPANGDDAGVPQAHQGWTAPSYVRYFYLQLVADLQLVGLVGERSRLHSPGLPFWSMCGHRCALGNASLGGRLADGYEGMVQKV